MSEFDMNQNPLTAPYVVPPFAAIRAEHVEPAVKATLAELSQELEKLERTAQPTWEGVVAPLENIEDRLSLVYGPVDHLLRVRNSPELRSAHEAVQADVVAFSLRIKQSEALMKALAALATQPQSLDESQRRTVEIRLREAKLAGIGLPEDQRQIFNEAARELSRLQTLYANQVLDSTKAWALELTKREDVSGLSANQLAMAASTYERAHADEIKSGHRKAPTAHEGPWRITLDRPSYIAFMKHAHRRDLREKLYRAFITKASKAPHDNTPLITEILAIRRRQAQLIGFKTFAELSVSSKMSGTVEAAENLLEELYKAAKPRADQEFRELEAFAREQGHQGPLALWDVAFYSERLFEARYKITDEELKPYFPLPRVLDGLFDLAKRLFNIEVRRSSGDKPVWHPDVEYFTIHDEKGVEIASFYLDPLSRPENKRGGAWMDTCVSRRRLGSKVRTPIAYLCCNGMPSANGKVALLTFDEVETLFHEFGHGLQHMLTRMDHLSVAGINGVEWDAVELPSQFMENWCFHEKTLIGMTAHFETGEPMPRELFERRRAARNFHSALATMRQLKFGIVDLELHHRFDPAGKETPFAVQERIGRRTDSLAQLTEDRFLCDFSHLFAGDSYAAGYYSYKWAEVLSADAFSAFEEAGLDNEAAVAQTGRKFRETVLALGGGRHPMHVFQDFRGRQPKIDALLRHNELV